MLVDRKLRIQHIALIRTRNLAWDLGRNVRKTRTLTLEHSEVVKGRFLWFPKTVTKQLCDPRPSTLTSLCLCHLQDLER